VIGWLRSVIFGSSSAAVGQDQEQAGVPLGVSPGLLLAVIVELGFGSFGSGPATRSRRSLRGGLFAECADRVAPRVFWGATPRPPQTRALRARVVRMLMLALILLSETVPVCDKPWCPSVRIFP
jgi:hypothetical protein